jgi:hypothetical protein
VSEPVSFSFTEAPPACGPFGSGISVSAARIEDWHARISDRDQFPPSHYRSVAHGIEVFRNFNAPTHEVFTALDPNPHAHLT